MLVAEYLQLTTIGCTTAELCEHQSQLMKHRLRMGAFVDALRVWMVSDQEP